MWFSITQGAASIQHEWLFAIGTLLNDPVIFALLVIGIGLFLERRKDARVRLAVGLLLTFVLVSAVKTLLEVERPCVPGEGICPMSYSLPSMHAAVAFTLLFAFLRRPVFPLVLVFALFVAFTRLNLGVHTFEDVAASLPIGFISFFLVNNLWRWGN